MVALENNFTVESIGEKSVLNKSGRNRGMVAQGNSTVHIKSAQNMKYHHTCYIISNKKIK